MSSILECEVTPALLELDIHPWKDELRDRLIIAVAPPVPPAGPVLISFWADDAREEAYASAHVLTVGTGRRAAIRDAINQLNAQPTFVTSWIDPEGMVFAYVCIELTCTTDAQKLIGLGFGRLVEWIGTHHAPLVRSAQAKRRASKLDRQVAEILRRSEPLPDSWE